MWCASTCRTTSSDACVASIHTGFTTFSAMTWAALSSDEHGDDHYDRIYVMSDDERLRRLQSSHTPAPFCGVVNVSHLWRVLCLFGHY
jgi:hypothetical protein